MGVDRMIDRDGRARRRRARCASRRSCRAISSRRSGTSRTSRTSPARSSASTAPSSRRTSSSSSPRSTRTGAATRRMSDLVLLPAACYPVYPAIAARGPLAAGGCTIDAGGAYVFRQEPSGDPARLQMFHQREIVRLGEPETVVAWRDTVARPRDLDPARRRARGRVRRGLRPVLRPPGPHARRQPARAGAEVRGPRPDRRATSRRRSPRSTTTTTISRRPTGSSWPTAAIAHTACLGFGLERISLALFHAHGLDVGRVAGRGPNRARAPMSAVTSGAVSLFGLDPATYRPHGLHTGERVLPRDELLRRRHHRAPACPRRRAARGHGHDGPPRLRGRPVHVLQAAIRPISSCSSASTSTRCSRTGRCRPRSPSCSRSGGR